MRIEKEGHIMRLFILSIFAVQLLFSDQDLHISTKFGTVPSNSLSKNTAFYFLYPDSKQGLAAKQCLKDLLKTDDIDPDRIGNIVKIFSTDKISSIQFSQEELKWINNATKSLKHRRLKGHSIWELEKITKLKDKDIDIARASLLTECENKTVIQIYEAILDLMALHIQNSLPDKPKAKEVITAINKNLFYDLGIKYPAVREGCANCARYSNLIHIINNRRGICLGTSLLYMAIGQRLGIDVALLDPIGHALVVYNRGNKSYNIETTRRGVETQRSIYTEFSYPTVPEVTHLEAICDLLTNNASPKHRDMKSIEKSLEKYEKSIQLKGISPHIYAFVAILYLLNDQEVKTKEILSKLKNEKRTLHAKNVYEKLYEDYRNKKIDKESIKIMLLSEYPMSRADIVKERNETQEVLNKYPQCRYGWYKLASLHDQLNNERSALIALHKCEQLDHDNDTVLYALAQVYKNRSNYAASASYLKILMKKYSENAHLNALVDQVQEIYPFNAEGNV